MRITLVKKNHRCRLVCERSDGSTDMADTGPSFPYHDLAHYVAERTIGLKEGFYGSIAAGRSMAELSDEDVIRSLGPGSWQAEVLARAVGSLATGACRVDEFSELVNCELADMGIDAIEGLTDPVAESMLREFRSIADAYAALADGESLTLEFAGLADGP
jgi:hypothetical protein